MCYIFVVSRNHGYFLNKKKLSIYSIYIIIINDTKGFCQSNAYIHASERITTRAHCHAHSAYFWLGIIFVQVVLHNVTVSQTLFIFHSKSMQHCTSPLLVLDIFESLFFDIDSHTLEIFIIIKKLPHGNKSTLVKCIIMSSYSTF